MGTGVSTLLTQHPFWIILEIRDIKYKQETGQLFLYKDKWFLRRIHRGFSSHDRPPPFKIFSMLRLEKILCVSAYLNKF